MREINKLVKYVKQITNNVKAYSLVIINNIPMER